MAGISTCDMLGEGFKWEAIFIGSFLSSQVADNNSDGKSIGKSDLFLLWVYTLKVEDHVTEWTFSQLSKVFPNMSQDTLQVIEKHVQALSEFWSIWYSCCINNCVCFVRPYENLTKCPNCKEIWYKASGTPRKCFEYLPLIPWLQAISANATHATKMHYQAKYVHKPSIIKNVFDSSHYQTLLDTPIAIDSSNPFFFFSDPCDIALGLSTDGFSLFKQHDKTLSSSIIISLLKFVSRKSTAFTSVQSQVQRSPGIGIYFAGHLFGNLSN